MINKDSFIRSFYRKNQVEKINSKLLLLGEKSKMDSVTFLTIQLLTTILIFMIVVYLIDFGYVIAPVIAIIYYYLFYYITIQSPIKKRIKKLDHEALVFFEILTLTLESGKNLDQALEITVFNIESELSNEFRKSLFEMKFGKSLIEALEDMKKRIPSITINNIILNITQTNIFGSSILETMNNQLDFLRDKQILEIKGEINKIPNKISVVSVVCVVPLILLLVLAPVVIGFLG